MFVTVVALRYALFVSRWSCGHFRNLTDSILFESPDKSTLFNSTHYIVLYPQNGDRIVTTDSMAPLHSVYKRTHCGTEHLLDFIAKDLHSRRMHGRTHAQADGQPENIVFCILFRSF